MSATAVKSRNLRDLYAKEVAPALQKDLGLTNVMSVPKIEKVVVNVGVGSRLKDEKFIDGVAEDLSRITGQRAVKTVAKKAIAGFKLREGNVVGVMVTLRGEKMYSFLEKMVYVALPRVRDFRGISSKGFDPQGNYNMGIREHIVFPEISADNVENGFPFEVTVVTTAKNPEEGYKLLKSLGFPFNDNLEDKE